MLIPQILVGALGWPPTPALGQLAPYQAYSEGCNGGRERSRPRAAAPPAVGAPDEELRLQLLALQAVRTASLSILLELPALSAGC